MQKHFMETPFDWDRLEEPTSSELALLDGRAWEVIQELISLERIDQIAKTPYLVELGDYAYIDLLNMLATHSRRLGRKATSDEFNSYRIEAIRVNMPIKTRTCDRRSYREVFSAVASNLGKLLAAARKRKLAKLEAKKLAQRGKSPEQKKEEREAVKARRAKAQAEAKDALEHGPRHGEFILPGIETRRLVASTSKNARKGDFRYRKIRKQKAATAYIPVTTEEPVYMTAAEINRAVREGNARHESNRRDFPGPPASIPKTMTFGFMAEVPKKDGFPRKNYRKEIGI